MQHPVQKKVREVGHRARWLARVHGLGWFTACTLLAVLLACLADYLLRFDEFGLRWMLSASVVAVVVWSGLRFLRPAFAFRPSDVEVALRIERRVPRLEQRLSSAIEFLAQDAEQPRAGSLELRRAVVNQAESLLGETDVLDCLDRRSAKRAGRVGAGVVLLLAAICAVDLAWFWQYQRELQPVPSSLLAASRLALPWSRIDWPRWNQLRFLDAVDRLAEGHDFEAEVVDQRGPLPDVVQIQYWFAGDRADQIQTKLMKPTPEGTAVHRLENVTRPFRYRALGGDHDNMDWIDLRLVEPPRLVSQQIRLHPPDYTGYPPRDSGPRVEALAGTRVVVQARVSKKLRSVRLRAPADAEADQVRVQLAEDGLGFSIPLSSDWTVRASGQYWFEMQDEQGVVGGNDQTWQIVATADEPPTVSLEQPVGNTYLTARAEPVLKAIVKDDLAVGRIELRYLRSDQSEAGQKSMALYEGPTSPRRPQADSPGTPGTPGDGSAVAGSRPAGSDGEKRQVETRWDLGDLAGLEPGSWIDFHVAASDYLPQWGESHTRRITIISGDQLDDLLAQRQAQILSRLSEVLRLQQTARSQTGSLQIQLRETGALSKADLDSLQSDELNQRQVGRQLTDTVDGLPGQIRQLVEQLESNRVDSPEVMRRMQALQTGLELLGRQQLPQIERELVEALKTAREHLRREAPSGQADSLTREALEGVASGQDQVVAALETMLGDLVEWDNYRRFSREINRLRRDQEEIREQTDQLRIDTLTKEQRDLTAQEKVDLKRLGQRQAELARQFDRIQGRMRQMQGELRTADPLAADTLGDAVDVARRLALSGQMRESGRSIEENRVGQAAQQQQQIAEGLDELLDVLANRREHELDRMLSQLQRSAQDLRELRRQQADLRRKMEPDASSAQDTAAGQLPQQAQPQEDLAEQTRRLARRLQRLQAGETGQSLEQAAEQQQQAAAEARQGNADAAPRSADSAQQKLDDAQRQLDQRLEQAEQDLFEEQLARLEQAVAGLVVRQESVLKTTVELEALRQDQNNQLQRGQLATLGDLAARQRDLATETGLFAEKVARARAFALSLEGAMREMARASRGLDGRETGQETQRAEQAALTRLQQLVEAMKQDPNRPADGENSPQQDPQQQAAPSLSPEDAVRILAELKLIKLMQQEINGRTEQLQEVLSRTGSWTPEQQREAEELAQEQGQLARLVLELMQSVVPTEDAQPADPAPPAGEGDPSRLPESPKPDPAGPDPAGPDPAAPGPGTSGLDQELLKDL